MSYSTATHLLECQHCVGANHCRLYYMRCNVIKTMPDGRLKIQVFGERYWKDKRDKVSIRYVKSWRVSEAKNI